MSAKDRSATERKSARNPVCPICGKPRDPRYDPFCSKRCSDVDLHRWLKGTYVIPGAKAEDADGTGEE